MYRALGGLCRGASTLIGESGKFSFPKEVMFRLRRHLLSKKMGKFHDERAWCLFRGVWLEGREGVESGMRSACGGGHRPQ